MNCQRGRIVLSYPAVLSEVKGETPLKFSLSGKREKVSVRSVKAGEKGLYDALLFELLPDENGEAECLLPMDALPHGPVTVRFLVGEGATRDIYHLQLFNCGGERFEEGLAANPQPAIAEGLELCYEDDFDSNDLSISNTGEGKKYYSHKPGGGDFSIFTFSDIESDKNPFFQKESYLIIRADEAKHSSGLISSIRKDGTGFAVKAPCFFECRMLGPNTIGSWPAFWLMTQKTYKGLHTPVDELDTIEAYGLEDLDHQNQIGYYATSHRWNQGKHETIDPDRFLDMRTFGNGTGWDMAFHTYGTLITEEETVYTCDGIPFFRHPSQPCSKTDPFFFMLNLAVGGNGWPVDISRYGKIDLYVDFVRVYGKKENVIG